MRTCLNLFGIDMVSRTYSAANIYFPRVTSPTTEENSTSSPPQDITVVLSVGISLGLSVVVTVGVVVLILILLRRRNSKKLDQLPGPSVNEARLKIESGITEISEGRASTPFGDPIREIKLGSGSFGDVWLAKTSDGDTVAMKSMKDYSGNAIEKEIESLQ